MKTGRKWALLLCACMVLLLFGSAAQAAEEKETSLQQQLAESRQTMEKILAAKKAKKKAPAPPVMEEEEEQLTLLTMTTGDLLETEDIAEAESITDAQARELDAAMAAYVPSETTLNQNRAEHFYYYEQLSGEAKEIYDILLSVANDPVEGNIGLMLTSTDPRSDELFEYYKLALASLYYDHPELFWLYYGCEDAFTFGYLTEPIAGLYYVYFSLKEPFDDYEEQMTAFNAAADEFLKDIDLSGSEYDIALQIHDRLIALVTYDYDLCERQVMALGHTAYGSLVQSSDGKDNYAVCDGYALAYEYLLQQCGMEAIVISGRAGNDMDSLGGHAWNLVKIDGEWYEVDATWDDRKSDWIETVEDYYGRGAMNQATYDYYMEALSDSDYMKTVEHYLFLVSTYRIDNFKPWEIYTYYTRDGAWSFSLVGSSVRLRYSSEELINQSRYSMKGNVVAMAPWAAKSYSG